MPDRRFTNVTDAHRRALAGLRASIASGRDLTQAAFVALAESRALLERIGTQFPEDMDARAAAGERTATGGAPG